MVFLNNAAKLEKLKEDEISLRYYVLKARLGVSQNIVYTFDEPLPVTPPPFPQPY